MHPTDNFARKGKRRQLEFIGSKVALLCDGAILTCLRDDRPGLRYANWWDLPGGGREGQETPQACLLRELQEEFGLRLAEDRLIWAQIFPAMIDHRQNAWFFGSHLTRGEIATIRFGDEGQRWEMMPLPRFLAHPRVIPAKRARTAVFLASQRPMPQSAAPI
jgi:8-oxo-dGTP diphosphatase